MAHPETELWRIAGSRDLDQAGVAHGSQTGRWLLRPLDEEVGDEIGGEVAVEEVLRTVVVEADE